MSQTYHRKEVHPAFSRRGGYTFKTDPCPHELTEEERAHIIDRMESGGQPRTGLVRKMLRLCDERLDIIRMLSSKLEKKP